MGAATIPATVRPAARPRSPRASGMTHTDRCVAYLLRKIEAGEIHATTRLGEPSLAREIGIDRGAVRAAFERLEVAGILHRIPRSGTYLKPMSLSAIRAANEVRRELEVLGAGLAARVATPAEKAQLVKTAALLDELTETYTRGEPGVWSAVRSMEIEFHTMLARFSHNPFLESMMSRDTFLQVCFPFLVLSTSLKQVEVQEYLKNHVSHTLLAETIARGEAAIAQALMRTHISDIMILVDRALEEKACTHRVVT